MTQVEDIRDGEGTDVERPQMEPTLWEKSRRGARGVCPPGADPQAVTKKIPAQLLRSKAPSLPELSELEVVRHFTRLSHLSRGVDTHFYPLGSCTMKYNPKVMDRIAEIPGFRDLHPRMDSEGMQGLLEALAICEESLAALMGMDAVTLAPAAGAHGELAGILIARRYFESRKDGTRTEILIPDSAHGTNPASAAMGGFSVRVVASGPDGGVDLDSLRKSLSSRTAMVMMTVPNTLGLFEKNLKEMIALVRSAGALLYMDGANFNAFMGVLRPGDLGFDIVHINTHKTLATPHGGGGPGSGPVGVTRELAPFLPSPRVVIEEGRYRLSSPEGSIGPLRSFVGSTLVLLRALGYMKMLGQSGLRDVSLYALLNANYLRVLLDGVLPRKGEGLCAHEFVLSAKEFSSYGLHASDFAKEILDAGYYAPTVSFPLIVPEALMIEPTETESKETLDRFARDFRAIFEKARRSPGSLKGAPRRTPVSRPDEVGAARDPVLTDPRSL
ncbi:MAG: aminomethyl-transferring glycine dehydrogenase subunit GcvPB [Leptospirillia bacterium]